MPATLILEALGYAAAGTAAAATAATVISATAYAATAFAINFAASYISYKLVFLTAFALLITVLLVKPSGIFSSSKGRKD